MRRNDVRALMAAILYSRKGGLLVTGSDREPRSATRSERIDDAVECADALIKRVYGNKQ
jgi:hypothetical protein